MLTIAMPLILSYSEMCEVLVYSSWEAEDSTKVGRCQPVADALQLDAQGSPDRMRNLIPTGLQVLTFHNQMTNPPKCPAHQPP